MYFPTTHQPIKKNYVPYPEQKKSWLLENKKKYIIKKKILLRLKIYKVTDLFIYLINSTEIFLLLPKIPVCNGVPDFH